MARGLCPIISPRKSSETVLDLPAEDLALVVWRREGEKGAWVLSRIMHSRLLTAVSVLALACVLGACGGSAGGDEAVSGSVNIEGSSTVYPITQAAAELFREENPDARIEVGGAGTSDGFEAFCQGDTQ